VRLEIFGSDGSVIIENDRVAAWNLRSGESNPVPAQEVGFTGGFASQDIWLYSHRSQVADMIAAICEERDPLVTGEEGRKSLEIFLGV
jgi:predicted dehydrogenase